jgi:hypothetical protein
VQKAPPEYGMMKVNQLPIGLLVCDMMIDSLPWSAQSVPLPRGLHSTGQSRPTVFLVSTAPEPGSHVDILLHITPPL